MFLCIADLAQIQKGFSNHKTFKKNKFPNKKSLLFLFLYILKCRLKKCSLISLDFTSFTQLKKTIEELIMQDDLIEKQRILFKLQEKQLISGQTRMKSYRVFCKVTKSEKNKHITGLLLEYGLKGEQFHHKLGVFLRPSLKTSFSSYNCFP